MIKYYCDWCNAEIEDDGFISDRLVEIEKNYYMVAMIGGQTYFPQFENKKKRDKYLLCDKCISRITTENLRYYDDKS